MREYARLSSLGFEFSASVGLLGWLGWLLDGWTGMAEHFPVFLLVGVFLGLGLGIYRLQLKLGQDSKNDSSSEDPEA
jgi:F0F1-type ATP synthase assembly protein I